MNPLALQIHGSCWHWHCFHSPSAGRWESLSQHSRIYTAKCSQSRPRQDQAEAFACHIRWPDGPIWPKHPLLQLYHWFFFQSCGTCVFPDADATLAFGVAPCHQSVCKTAGGGRKPKHMSNVRMMICFRGATCACKIKISKSYACDAAVMRLCSQFLSFVSLIMAESTMDA